MTQLNLTKKSPINDKHIKVLDSGNKQSDYSGDFSRRSKELSNRDLISQQDIQSLDNMMKPK
jgi:hypothetical protein